MPAARVDFAGAVTLRSELEDRYGKAESYAPPPDGAIAPDRMEAFLRVRELTQPKRREIAATFEEFPMTEEAARELEREEGLNFVGRILGLVGSGLGLGAKIGGFMEARNQALLESGMGLGEYSYIYVVAYYSWLGHSAGEGPQSRSEGRVKIDDQLVGRDLHRRILQILQNQLQQAGPEADPALSAEVSRLSDDRRRIPWADGLPQPIEASLQPYRERLESTYVEVTNPFELTVVRRRGRFSYSSD